MGKQKKIKTEKGPRGESVRGGILGFADIAGEAKLGVYASSGAFYLFLSIFPTAALLCSLLPLLPFTQEALLDYLSAVLPDFMQELLRSIIDGMYSYSAAAFSISVVLLLWSAGKAFIGVMRGLNRIYSGEDRSMLRLRGLSSLYMLLFLAFMLVTLGISLFQKSLMQGLVQRWPRSAETVETLMKLRFFPGMLLLAVFFSLMYRFLPNAKLRYVDQIPGALLAAALWMLLSWVFSLYLHRFGASSVYGSLATVAFALMWIYWCISLTLLGGCFNVWISGKRSAVSASPKEK
jgi:Predicted membrane protein